MPDIFFDDIQVGRVQTYGHHHVERDAMVAFARDFDPQPFHLDEAAAAASPAGRLIASGWYTVSVQMRMLCDAWLLRAAGLGAPGIDEVKWLRPVVPDDVLSVRETILETRASKSRPDRGLVQFRLETLNARGEPVLAQTHWGMFARRGAEPEKHGRGPSSVPAKAEAAAMSPCTVGLPGQGLADFDAIEVGQVTDLGSYHFAAEEVVRFARSFDPQPFHVDAEAAAESPFGALAASGWHTASAWMSRLVAHRQAVQAAALAEGRMPPRYGVSPGFRDLKWKRPVYAGTTIHFASEVVEKRRSASRPGWGLVMSRNTGWDAAGELVFEFIGSGFVASADAP